MNDKFVDMLKCMADKYETADFIASDPVQFPRRYSGRDAEVSGFITSWLSFGNRKAIIGAAERMDREFGGSPYGWLMDRQYVKVYNYLTRYGREEDKNVPKKDESIKKVLEEIEDKAIESRYTNMYDWQRRDLSKEDLFEYAEEMRKCLDKIFDLAIDERIK